MQVGDLVKTHNGNLVMITEIGGDLGRVFDNRSRTTGAIGHPGSIANVNDILVGKVPLDCVDHREPADAGIEYADRKGVHGKKEALASTKPELVRLGDHKTPRVKEE